MDILRAGGGGEVLGGGIPVVSRHDGKERRKTCSGLIKVVLLNIRCVVSDPTSFNTLR